ncbi:hypothetical protein ACIXT4_02520 [Bacteroides fragilis]|uniref:hypothetical protein n=1 Tax=Bacteroides fragilis TaxID=817 RepID=UPI001E3E1015|nr:hypothetical protein [Bacteroides fragilis]MCS2806194.1 hypothetical protein [Bacteroides fragilis]
MKYLRSIKMILPFDFQMDKYGVHVRLVKESDAQFIVSLRTNPQLNKYIHFTSNDVIAQVNWIKSYKERERKGIEYYFIYSFRGVDYGVSRLYNITEKDFTSGSWVFLPTSPVGLSVLSSIIVKEIAYDILGLESDYADIRKNNKSVIKFNMSFQPEIIKEDEENIYLRFDKALFNNNKMRHVEVCTNLLGVEYNK